MSTGDRKLATIMKNRAHAPAPSGNLAARIIEAARFIPHPRAGWRESFICVFTLPRPVIAMTLILLFGIALGIFTQDLYDIQDDDNFISTYIENSFNIEDLL